MDEVYVVHIGRAQMAVSTVVKSRKPAGSSSRVIRSLFPLSLGVVPEQSSRAYPCFLEVVLRRSA